MFAELDQQHILPYILRAYFLTTSAGVLIARIIPSFRRAFIPYGKTRGGTQAPTSLLQVLANITVPKGWFWHYYLISVILSVFWAVQFVVCSFHDQWRIFPSLRRIDGRNFLTWGIMMAQGSRRLYESLYIQKPSSARMWIGHYLVGIVFYMMMSLMFFAEGSSTDGVTTLQSLRDSIDTYAISSITLFIIGSIWQFHTHSILASLRPSRDMNPTYSAPPRSCISFQLFLTPHYTAEVLIYLALTLLTRNWTMFTALLWVIISLSVSAGETREWANAKFKGDEWGRWNILPFIY